MAARRCGSGLAWCAGSHAPTLSTRIVRSCPPRRPDLLAAFLAAVNARDLDAAIELWREDAVIVQPDGQPLRGRARPSPARCEALIDGGVELCRRRSRASSRRATSALVSGTLTLDIPNGDGPDGRFTNRSNSVVIYKRGADGWRIALDAPWGLPQGLRGARPLGAAW